MKIKGRYLRQQFLISCKHSKCVRTNHCKFNVKLSRVFEAKKKAKYNFEDEFKKKAKELEDKQGTVAYRSV